MAKASRGKPENDLPRNPSPAYRGSFPEPYGIIPLRLRDTGVITTKPWIIGSPGIQSLSLSIVYLRWQSCHRPHDPRT
jgi:hypothetical protein